MSSWKSEYINPEPYNQYGKFSGRNYVAQFHWDRECENAVRLWNESVYCIYPSTSGPGTNIYRYRSNNNIPPVNILDVWFDLELIGSVDYNDMIKLRAKEEVEQLDEILRNRKEYIESLDPETLRDMEREERYEMRAAFGPGVHEIVDCLTGTTRKVSL